MPRSRHGDGHLMKRLGQQRPEVPVAVRRCACPVRGSRLTAWFRSGNFSGSRRKKTGVLLPTRSQLPVVGVELDGEAADVALGIGRAALSGHGREAHEARSVCLPTSAKIDGPGVFRDVVRHGEGSEGSRSLGVHAPFGDDLAVEVGEFFEEPRVLRGYGAAFPGCLNVLVVGDGPAVFGCQFLFVHMAFVFGCDGFPACKCMI